MKIALVASALLIAGCRPISNCLAPRQAVPFDVVLGKGAAWSPEHAGYDPKLPGYHLIGDIASITLTRRTDRVLKKLVLAIRTSPSMPAMLENFTLAAPDITLSAAMPSEQKLVEIKNPKAAKPWETVATEDKAAYFKFEVVGDEVRVTLLSEATKLMTGQSKMSWIDWYR